MAVKALLADPPWQHEQLDQRHLPESEKTHESHEVRSSCANEWL